MTTLVVDIENNKIVTDSRCTEYCAQRYEMALFNKNVTLPFFKKKFVRYNDEYTWKSIRIIKDGFTEFLCGSGIVSEIDTFIKAYRKNKIPKSFLKNSTVFVVKFNGHNWTVDNYNNSVKGTYEDTTAWITSGSGSELAAGAIDILSKHDKNRALKAVKVAIDRDKSSGGTTQVLNIEDYCDIY